MLSSITGSATTTPTLGDLDLVDEAVEGAAADGVLELADGLGLDLADAFTGDREDLADLFQRVGIAVGQAVAEADDLALAIVQALQHVGDPLLEKGLGHFLQLVLFPLVLDELAEEVVVVVADRLVQRQRLP